MKWLHYTLMTVGASMVIIAGTTMTPVESSLPGFNAASLTADASSTNRPTTVYIAQNSASISTPFNFTMTLPKSAGQPFSMVSLTEQNQAKISELTQFDLASSQAFTGTLTTKGNAIAIKETWVDETGTIWIEFARPLPPQTTITLVLKPRKLPSTGTSEFGIAAYPDVDYPVPILVSKVSLSRG